jgi:hypothetical protein
MVVLMPAADMLGALMAPNRTILAIYSIQLYNYFTLYYTTKTVVASAEKTK